MNPSRAAASGIRHATVHSGSIPLHVAEAGSGELVILLHGFPDFWYGWKDILVDLGRDFLAVAPDGRGYNLSGKPKEIDDYSIDALCGDIRRVMEHYGAGKCVIVGHDWGGMVAWFFAARHPDLVRRLVVVNSPHPALFQSALFYESAQRASSQYISRLRDPGCEERLAAAGMGSFWKGIFGELEDGGIFGAGDKAAYLEAWARPGALSGMLNWYRASPFIIPRMDEAFHATVQAETLLSGFEELIIEMPCLVLWGMADRVLQPVLLEGLEDMVPRLDIRRLAGIGHGAIHEIPGTVSALIREFVRDLP